ncbi:unnamed protein product [Ascophyllum nodosum]
MQLGCRESCQGTLRGEEQDAEEILVRALLLCHGRLCGWRLRVAVDGTTRRREAFLVIQKCALSLPSERGQNFTNAWMLLVSCSAMM